MKDINIHFSKNCGFRWSSLNTRKYKIFVKGFGFKDGKYFKDEKIGNLFKPLAEKSSNKYLFENFIEIVKAMNGNFAIVIEGNNWLFASVDRVRSFPLFYGKKKHKFFISDDAYWVREQVGDNQIDKLASIEFLLTGYVTGSDTLFPNVKQLQAGESLFIQKIQQTMVDIKRYYYYRHYNPFKESQDILIKYFTQSLINIFQRLIESTRGYTLIVPLSGGIDSRLIIFMLKCLGYEKVICFSYGRQGNWESKISRQVAKDLGYKWFFIPYTHKNWRRWFQSKERRAYYQYVNGLTSVPHIQDWPAVYELRKNKYIPQQSIFIPGHTGDFISGGHIPKYLFKQKQIDKNKLIQMIWKKHYSLWNVTDKKNRLKSAMCNRILTRIRTHVSCETLEQAASIYESWEWQERQAKFIINSVRVYEFWGYEWRIPFWDNEWMNLWSRVPLNLKLNKKLYVDICKGLFRNFFDYSIIIYKWLFRIPHMIERLFYKIDKNSLFPFLFEYHISSLFNEYQWHGMLSKKHYFLWKNKFHMRPTNLHYSAYLYYCLSEILSFKS